MISIPLYFKDSVQFAAGYERVVHGGRGAYVENLKSHFNQEVPREISPEPFYYYWLNPEGRIEKIYWQINTVKYADYKIGYYYISPSFLKPFVEVNPNIKMLF